MPKGSQLNPSPGMPPSSVKHVSSPSSFFDSPVKPRHHWPSRRHVRCACLHLLAQPLHVQVDLLKHCFASAAVTGLVAGVADELKDSESECCLSQW